MKRYLSKVEAEELKKKIVGKAVSVDCDEAVAWGEVKSVDQWGVVTVLIRGFKVKRKRTSRKIKPTEEKIAEKGPDEH